MRPPARLRSTAAATMSAPRREDRSMAIRWNVVAAALAFSWCVMAGASAADERPTAILQSASGTPAIFELTQRSELHNASAVGIGRHYELPMEIQTGSADSATFLLPNSIIEVSPN